MRIAPGATLRLTVSQSPESSGSTPAEKRLTIFSNDPLRPAKEISIQLI